MVKSIAKTVEEIIDADASLQDSLVRDYANFSGMARSIQPTVEEVVGRPVTVESLVTAIKRAKVTYAKTQISIMKIVSRSIIHLRTDIAKITVERTKRTLENMRKGLALFHGEFLQIIEGVSAVTVIFDQKLFDEVIQLFEKHEILDKKHDLAAIVVQSPHDIINTPGCVTAFYNPISRSHINIEETMSCFTDTILVIGLSDVGPAMKTLTSLISQARMSVALVPKRTRQEIRKYEITRQKR